MCAQLLHVCLSLCDLMSYSPPGSSVHEILQARILEWVVMPSSRESSCPRDWTQVSCSSCIAGWFFTSQLPGKPNLFLTSNFFFKKENFNVSIDDSQSVKALSWFNICLECTVYRTHLNFKALEGGGFRMGNTCIPVADSFLYLAKPMQ